MEKIYCGKCEHFGGGFCPECFAPENTEIKSNFKESFRSHKNIPAILNENNNCKFYLEETVIANKNKWWKFW